MVMGGVVASRKRGATLRCAGQRVLAKRRHRHAPAAPSMAAGMKSRVKGSTTRVTMSKVAYVMDSCRASGSVVV